MLRLLTALLFMISLNACSGKTNASSEVPKPRYHKGWYKNHRWHKKVKAGRFRLRLFEKQGTKKVKMK